MRDKPPVSDHYEVYTIAKSSDHNEQTVYEICWPGLGDFGSSNGESALFLYVLKDSGGKWHFIGKSPVYRRGKSGYARQYEQRVSSEVTWTGLNNAPVRIDFTVTYRTSQLPTSDDPNVPYKEAFKYRHAVLEGRLPADLRWTSDYIDGPAKSAGVPVKDLRTIISVDKQNFGLDESIPVHWELKNLGKKNRVIIWHDLHYCPVVFEIGKKGQGKYLVEDMMRFFVGALPAPPEAVVLEPGQSKKFTFDMQRFLNAMPDGKKPGIYEVTGIYSLKDARLLSESSYLKQPEFASVVTDLIDSGPIEITLEE
jgi:hypothetical protein